MRTRFCPASECNTQADARRMLCSACWAKLPVDVQEGIKRHMSLYKTPLGPPMVEAINWLNAKDRGAA